MLRPCRFVLNLSGHALTPLCRNRSPTICPQVSMQFFLDFCTQLLDEHQAAAAASAAESSAAAAATSPPSALDADAESGTTAAAASGEHYVRC